MKIYSQDTKKRISILAIIILSVFGTTSVDAQTDNANTGPNSVFVKDAVKKTFEQNASPLRNYLFSRREALIKLQSLPSEELQAVTLEARTTAEQRSGLRRMRIRGFQIDPYICIL